jgi:hypothetical protein
MNALVRGTWFRGRGIFLIYLFNLMAVSMAYGMAEDHWFGSTGKRPWPVNLAKVIKKVDDFTAIPMRVLD